jgi:ribosomal protein S18 acetylase RimI-like enzyme
LSSTSTVRPLRKDELFTAARTLTFAFDEDPLFRFLLPGEAERWRWSFWVQHRSLGEALGGEGVFTIEPSLGVIGLFMPGKYPVPFMHSVAVTRLPPSLPRIAFARAGLKVWSEMSRLHPKTPHLYVYVLGVHPSQKGRGLGKALMQHACALADKAGVPIYLETGNPVNLPFYRRFGLEVVQTITAHGGAPLWTMIQK